MPQMKTLKELHEIDAFLIRESPRNHDGSIRDPWAKWVKESRKDIEKQIRWECPPLQ